MTLHDDRTQPAACLIAKLSQRPCPASVRSLWPRLVADPAWGLIRLLSFACRPARARSPARGTDRGVGRARPMHLHLYASRIREKGTLSPKLAGGRRGKDWSGSERAGETTARMSEPESWFSEQIDKTDTFTQKPNQEQREGTQ